MAPDRIRFDNHVDVGVKMAEAICRRLRFSNDDTEQILALVANHMRFSHVPQMKESTLQEICAHARVRASTSNCTGWTARPVTVT